MKGHILGKLIITCDIKTITGLHIGGPKEGLKIGGLDNPVIKDPEGKPYIPGSSLKGKLRTLLERYLKVEWNKDGMHMCTTKEEYENCKVCKIFGILGGEKGMEEVYTLTRLIVRDTYLNEEDEEFKKIKENLPLEYTEIKTEVSINRITGTAKRGALFTPERVPAGAKFKDSEFIFTIYDEKDKELLKELFISMKLLEDDYLGGMGTRGYGKIKFENIKIYWNSRKDYEEGKLRENVIFEGGDIEEIIEKFDQIKDKIQTQ